MINKAIIYLNEGGGVKRRNAEASPAQKTVSLVGA